MTTQLIFFSGLAADSDVFAPQKIAFPQLVVPQWPTPHQADSLITYCDRLAEDLRIQDDVIIGGASFGGIIAQLVALRLKPQAIILIGSVRSPEELPHLLRLCRPLKPLIPFLPVRFFQLCCTPAATRFARRFIPHMGELARQFCKADRTVFKWSISRLLDWPAAPAVDCPVFQIHGSRDFVLTVRFTHPEVVIKGGGHVISLTHPKEVNDFIFSVLQKVADAK